MILNIFLGNTKEKHKEMIGLYNQHQKAKFCQASKKPEASGLTGLLTTGQSCKECVYFSHKNCGMDVSRK